RPDRAAQYPGPVAETSASAGERHAQAESPQKAGEVQTDFVRSALSSCYLQQDAEPHARERLPDLRAPCYAAPPTSHRVQAALQTHRSAQGVHCASLL